MSATVSTLLHINIRFCSILLHYVFFVVFGMKPFASVCLFYLHPSSVNASDCLVNLYKANTQVLCDFKLIQYFLVQESVLSVMFFKSASVCSLLAVKSVD